MTINDKNADRRLSKLLNHALIPAGFRPKNNDNIEAMLETISGEPLSGEKFARMLRKIRGDEALGIRQKEEIDSDSKTLTEQQKELFALYRAKGEDIPAEVQAILEEMRKRAADLKKDEQKDEP